MVIAVTLSDRDRISGTSSMSTESDLALRNCALLNVGSSATVSVWAVSERRDRESLRLPISTLRLRALEALSSMNGQKLSTRIKNGVIANSRTTDPLKPQR